MKELVKLTVKGHVQGVGFRWFTKKTADSLGVHGYVKNLPNGDVEIEAEADRESLKEFVEKVKAGPMVANVKDWESEWTGSSDEYDSFQIAH